MLYDNYSRIFSNTNNSGWKLLMLSGFLLVLFGLMIILIPEILVALVAGILLFTGITIMINAWHLRKQNSGYQRTIKIRWFD